MKRKGIKNLIIDFGGVLIDLDRDRCIRNFEQLGVADFGDLIDADRQRGVFME